MARPPSYNTIELKVPAKLELNSKKVSVKDICIETVVKKQNNGGAIITLSQNYANKKALVFIVKK